MQQPVSKGEVVASVTMLWWVIHKPDRSVREVAGAWRFLMNLVTEPDGVVGPNVFLPR